MIYIIVVIAIVIAFWFFGDITRFAKSRWHEKSNSPSTLVEAPTTETRKNKTKNKETDNFKRIYGIGPETEKALHRAGIMRFQDLADADVSRLDEIVERVNPLMDPSSWSAQAALAARGAWAEFNRMQADLQKRELDRRKV